MIVKSQLMQWRKRRSKRRLKAANAGVAGDYMRFPIRLRSVDHAILYNYQVSTSK